MKEDNLEYIKILKALIELPFPVGKTLLADFLVGDYKNKSITKNSLDKLYNFDSLHWSKEKIYQEIDRLIATGMIELSTSDYNRFVKILKLTMKGQNEITHPTLPKKEIKNKIKFKRTEITEEDKEKFKELESFLKKYNNEQKKAIISEAEKILCVAGAGSGKTTVLTKRIEFLVKYRGIPPEKILAITFTRKARQEMEKRLYELNVNNKIKVHTFNSFCEEILRKHENRIYGRHTRVQSYADKSLAMNMALGNLGIDMEDALQSYFTHQQRKFKTGNQLSNSFMNDCFSVMDYFKVTGEKEYDFSKNVDIKNRHNAQRVYQITKYLKEHMIIQGLRDYTDQILDATKFLKENISEIPEFEHILIDEYQDVNTMQVKLINLLKPVNLFAVGDPRQSIFGWRGADINYILNFEKDYADSEIVHLTKNYRSTKEIVEFINKSIISMGLPDLEHHLESEDTKIKIKNFESEEAERDFVVKKILESDISRNEIFVLVRTNRQLQELSQLMKKQKISHTIKSDEIQNFTNGKTCEVTLATIHAIKGLEAKKVFVVGCNEQNFPCKASDHPAIEMIKTDDYNKLEEERRLFYVAISRTKEILYLTYS
ncbi:MAG: UvrD-helicase domain-containing protein, partial [Nanoarchaeota archaeon]|nr:UvrD-helicase domain-containing protein [Nanoarchaeota archaeon]